MFGFWTVVLKKTKRKIIFFIFDFAIKKKEIKISKINLYFLKLFNFYIEVLYKLKELKYGIKIIY